MPAGQRSESTKTCSWLEMRAVQLSLLVWKVLDQSLEHDAALSRVGSVNEKGND